mmetsp:Transcript_13229/g.32333  ORF Transcript_13229/g.32333 Transcript_13229/m.32333 type:complete len:287 (+) Transcript_13229:207-1067(+)
MAWPSPRIRSRAAWQLCPDPPRTSSHCTALPFPKEAPLPPSRRLGGHPHSRGGTSRTWPTRPRQPPPAACPRVSWSERLGGACRGGGRWLLRAPSNPPKLPAQRQGCGSGEGGRGRRGRQLGRDPAHLLPHSPSPPTDCEIRGGAPGEACAPARGQPSDSAQEPWQSVTHKAAHTRPAHTAPDNSPRALAPRGRARGAVSPPRQRRVRALQRPAPAAAHALTQGRLAGGRRESPRSAAARHAEGRPPRAARVPQRVREQPAPEVRLHAHIAPQDELPPRLPAQRPD